MLDTMSLLWNKSKIDTKKPALRAFLLFLLSVYRVLLSNRVELLGLVLLARILLILVVVGRVVDVTLPDAVFVAFCNQSNESFL